MASITEGKIGRREPGQRREEIIAAALVLFTRHGVYNVSTRQIAQAVGISQPSLYGHFANSAEIAEEICARGFAELSRSLEAAFSSEGTGIDRLLLAARAYVDFGLGNPDVYRIAFMVEKSYDDPREGPGRGLEAGIAVFDLMADAARRTLGDANGSLAAQSIWASLHGLVSLLIARPNFPWVDREALIAAHIDHAVHGF